MKYPIAMLAALLTASSAINSPHADEIDIKTVGGAFMGGWSYAEIDPKDALLNVKRDDRSLRRVRAGYIGNKTYREVWNFDDSWLSYDKLPTRSHIRNVQFNEKNAPKVIFGSRDLDKYKVLKAEKLSRRIIVVTYQDLRAGSDCTALVYRGEESVSHNSRAYGDYSVNSIACLPRGSDPSEMLAMSAHYLSLVKKDGRPIANLKPYNFPELKRRPASRAPSGSGESPFGKATAKRVCNMATESGAWQQQPSLQKWVAEAHNRGFTVQDCENILTGVSTNVAAVRPDVGRDLGKQAGSNTASINDVDTDKVLAYWRTNQNVLRKSISKETGGLRSGSLAFDEFDIVGAQLSQADSRYVKLHTVYTLQFGSGSSASVASTEDSLGTPLYQTVIVNPRDNSVVEVRPVTTEKPR